MRTVVGEFSRAKRGWVGAGRCNPVETVEARLEARVIGWRLDRFFAYFTCAGSLVNTDLHVVNRQVRSALRVAKLEIDAFGLRHE
jgi:hypothetical protein